MIRIINIHLFVLAIVLFAGLYHIRYAADVKIRDIRKTRTAIERATLEGEVLQAEWISLNNPARLEVLSEQYLGMVPLTASQLHHAKSYAFKGPAIISAVSMDTKYMSAQ